MFSVEYLWCMEERPNDSFVC